MDELDSLVRKLRMEKRMVTSQYNDAKASHEAALAQVNHWCLVYLLCVTY